MRPVRSAPPPTSLKSFLGELLAEQQQLQTPVARFAASDHSALRIPQSAIHRDLIPLTAPAAGEQYAFEVDLDSCSGCKACVAGCHSLNGLDENETWRDVGLVVGGDRRHPFQQTITSACHHCADPACANGCPVLAYEKDPVTGIVRHLDDQCIGCSYCILKCPYDVPKFNDRLGIVRKCDMCHGRLAAGEAPACVQACPTHAIKIVKVDVSTSSFSSPVASQLTAAFLSVAPDPSYTRPTTRYISKRPLPVDLRAADAATLQLQPAHWPLVVLLTLMAMAVGCSMTDKVLALPTPALAVGGWLAGAIGLAFSVLHLGQPLRAWRIFLGLRKSWLSREAVVFGAWFPLATIYTAVRLGWLPLASGAWRDVLAISTAALGASGLICSVMVYADTKRDFWRIASTAPRFFGSALVLGLASALAIAPSQPLAVAFMLATFAKLAFELRTLHPLNSDDPDGFSPSPAVKTARLLNGALRPVFGMRVLTGIIVGATAPLTIATGIATTNTMALVLALTLLGELAERFLFFRAVVAPKMPGLPTFVPASTGRA